MESLGGTEVYKPRLTSGFNIASGVRGAIPKDLWFGVYRHQNEEVFVGNPQLFMIVSGRGVELGFDVTTHPSDFSNSAIKTCLREAFPAIYRLLPDPSSELAKKLEGDLNGLWLFRKKTRLDPGHSDFETFDSWLRYFKTGPGKEEGGGCIARYFVGSELDGADLKGEATGMVDSFRVLMERIRPSDKAQETLVDGVGVDRTGLAGLFQKLFRQFPAAREGPFRQVPELWATMEQIQGNLEALPCLQTRRDIIVKWSLGKGVWANVPWVAVLNGNVTTSTQRGIYVVFLISQDLTALYLTLNQGITDLIDDLGQRTATQVISDRTETYRQQVQDLTKLGIEVGGQIDLGASGWRGRNYELGTIAFVRFPSDRIPSDGTLDTFLAAMLDACDRLAERPNKEPGIDPGETSSGGGLGERSRRGGRD